MNLKKLAMVGVLLGSAALLRADGPTPTNVSHKKVHKPVTLSLSITEDGFVPADLKAEKGHPIRLVVTRRTDQTCAKQIVIPGYKVAKDLPLNVPVTIFLTPKKTGDINYTCGMGMLHGVISVD